jgi:peroxiredoxin
VDPVSKVAMLRDKLGITFPLYSDPTHAGIKAWGIYDARNEISRPATFVVAKGGTIVYRYVGESPSDRPTSQVVLEVLRKRR